MQTNSPIKIETGIPIPKRISTRAHLSAYYGIDKTMQIGDSFLVEKFHHAKHARNYFKIHSPDKRFTTRKLESGLYRVFRIS